MSQVIINGVDVAKRIAALEEALREDVGLLREWASPLVAPLPAQRVEAMLLRAAELEWVLADDGRTFGVVEGAKR